jgi:ribosomal protein L37AE/L43A
MQPNGRKMATKYQNERYECHACDDDIGQPGGSQGWRCAACGQLLQIYAEDNSGRQVIERVPASEIKKGDLLLQDGRRLSESNVVINIESQGAGLYKIALREFGVLKKIPANKEFNRIQGSW